MSHIQIKTEIHGDLIVHEVIDPIMGWPGDERRRVIAREVMNTKDAHTREALIRMGWTPPGEEDAHRRAAEEQRRQFDAEVAKFYAAGLTDGS